MPWGPWRASPFSFLFCLAPFVCRSVCLWAGFEAPVCLRAYLCACSLSHIGAGGCVLVIFLCALFFCTGEVCVRGFHLCALFPCCVSSLFLSLSLSLASSRRWCYSLPTTHVSCVRVFHVSVLCSFFFVALLLSPLCLFFCVLCSLVCSCGGFGPLVCVCGGLSHVSGSKLSSFPRLSG